MKLRTVFLGLVLPMSIVSTAIASNEKSFQFVDESSRLPPNDEPPGTSTTDVDLVDVDSDGDLDIFIAQGTAGLAGRPNRLLINDGDGSFTDESATRLPAAVANSTKADFGDVDGDGDLDVIIANVGPEQLLLNDGDGFFADGSAQLPPPVNIFSNISADAAFADIDGDGDLDVLVSNENPFNPSPLGGAQNRVFVNDGAGSFTDQTAARLPAATDQTGSMAGADLDGDGDTDILVGNRGQEKVLINDGAGFFTDETATRFPVTVDSTRRAALGDLDDDGDLDVVTANSRGEPLRVYFNDGDGHFTEGPFTHAPVTSETNSDVELADVDGDGDLDAYVVNAGTFVSGHGFVGGQDQYFMNNGHGLFIERTKKHLPQVADPTTDAALGDIDGDGDLDVVVGNTGEGEAGFERIYINDGHP